MALRYIETKKSAKIFYREWLVGFSAFLIILVSPLFPQTMLGESFWLSFFLFCVFPIIIIRFLFKEPFRNFGFSSGKTVWGIIFSVILVVSFVFLNYCLVFRSPYAGQIPVVRFITLGFSNFILFEIFLSLPLHFFSEIFFRGFLQLGLEKKLGFFSLLLASVLQTAPFLKGNWIVIGLIFSSSIAAGIIVRFSRSLLYSTAAMWLISISLDIMLIRMINRGS